MSGGHFNYIDSQLKSEIFGWSDKSRNVFKDKEISQLIWDVLDLIREYDWYESGDTCETDYLEAKKKFKDKWLKNDTERCKRIVDEAIAECKEELYKTYGIEIVGDKYKTS
jgi:hypothetical protein|nr:MAG TPA: hypothetical protein [Caudoviricetes sp.]